jgi:hypothetical protein
MRLKHNLDCLALCFGKAQAPEKFLDPQILGDAGCICGARWFPLLSSGCYRYRKNN